MVDRLHKVCPLLHPVCNPDTNGCNIIAVLMAWRLPSYLGQVVG